ncbi:ThiJ/PfpI [Exidia glandulosa HHB12029]|uniref:D-lactate dehydratase n=1 Tax=Exidia glandulosa HHB12029 TaxID=1314781 RepID=A0A165QJ80_EXIGL|nr:ThiJ/PfpI [Exidia glandulosa HHB12029]
MSRVLFVYTSADKTLTGAQTGWYLPEAAHPYYVLAPHFEIDFAAPAGPNPPVDESSVKSFTDDESTKFLVDPAVQSKFKNAKKLSEVNAADYAAIFYVGGHGPVLDLASDPVNAKLVSSFWQAGKIVSAVCHGPGALVQGVDASGKSIFAGRKAVSFTNVEEEQAGKVKDIPFLVESKIVELGGTFEKAPEPWGAKVIVDGKLITGQNPASAKGVGEALLTALKA